MEFAAYPYILYFFCLNKVDPQSQLILKANLAVERLHTAVAHIDIRILRENALLAKRHKPVAQIALEVTVELVVDVNQETRNRDASVFILALVKVPAVLAEQTVNGSDRSVDPADGKLATLVAEPDHELLGRAAGAVAFGV